MKKIFFTFSIVFFCLSARAQYYYDRSKNPDKTVSQKPTRDFDHFFFLSWDNNMPLSNKDYIDEASSLGTKLGFRKRLNDIDRFWVGADLGWAVYQKHLPYNTFTSGTQSTSVELYNYTYSYSLGGSFDYFILPMEKLAVPYAGFSIGVAYEKYSQYYNIYGTTANSWGLLMRPEVGLLIGFKENSSWKIKAAAHYDYSSNSNSDFGYKNFTSIGFQVGIVKMAW